MALSCVFVPARLGMRFAVVLFLVSGCALLAQKPVLIKDVNTRPGSEGSDPGEYQGPVQTGQVTWFAAYHPATGVELYRLLAGVRTVLLKDINPGPRDAWPQNFTPVGNRLFFTAAQAATGDELWTSDGTATGTRMVADIWPGTHNSGIWYMAPSPITGSVVFGASHPVSGESELWTSDGTAAGTKLLKDIHPGTAGSHPQSFRLGPTGKLTYFAADDGTSGIEPWVTDGTTAGTRRLMDVASGSTDSLPSGFTVFGNRMLFEASVGTGRGLWITDGTTSGTKLLKAGFARWGMLADAVVMAGKIYFQADDGLLGAEPWVSDGTPAGTKLLVEIAPGPASGGFESPAILGSRIFFAGCDGSGCELWQTDGTAAGTRRVADIYPGLEGSFPSAITAVGSSHVVFRAYGGANKGGVWVSDGTAQGTRLVLREEFSSPHGYWEGMLRIGTGRVIFAHDDGTSGRELWHTDGTAAGTRLLADINSPGTASADVDDVVEMGGQLFFSADDGLAGRELWTSDGTAAGTRLLKDITTGPGGSDVSELCALGRRLYFVATTPANGTELWVSDGTATGTRLFKDLVPGPGSSSPRSLTRVGNRICFAAWTSTTGVEPWIIDGPSMTTRMIQDLAPGTTSSNPYDFAPISSNCLTPPGGWFIFAAKVVGGNGAWVSNGTAKGTRPASIPMGTSPSGFTEWNGKVYYVASSLAHGEELWVTDGCQASMLKDILVGPLSSSVLNLTPHGTKLYFTANQTLSPRQHELWVTDGTAAGTKQVVDIAGPYLDASPTSLTSMGSRYLYFAATGGYESGSELWRSDGTAAGTQPLPEIYPGSHGSGPGQFRGFARLGGSLYFSASDGRHGRELWSVDNGATASSRGTGCGAAARPSMVASDPILGASMAVSGQHAPTPAVAVTLLSLTGRRPTSLFGCEAWVDLTTTWTTLTAFVSRPSWSYQLRIPNSAALTGITLASQTWFVAPTVFPIGMTNGVDLTFGR